jgi:LysM repeat protein
MPSRDRSTVVLSLGIVLLVACATRPIYYDTPTPEPSTPLSPIPTSILVTATAPPMPTPTPAGPPTLRIEPSPVNLAVGETRLVQVWLENADRLHTIELQIEFEPRYVSIEDTDPAAAGIQVQPGIVPVPAQVIRNEVDNEAGLITYHVAQVPGSPVSGAGMVTAFTVRALAEGGSPLQFKAVSLHDPEGQPLPAPEQEDGLIVIGAGDVTASPTTGAGPTETLPPATPSAAKPVPTTPTPAPSPLPTSAPATTGIYHTVQAGENLFRISLRYGTTVDAIVVANKLPDEISVQAGQMLLIPVSPPAGRVAYVVQPGDTLYGIARRFDTTVESLAALNGIGPSYAIQAGQMLVIVP